MNCIVIEDNIVQEQLIVSHINETRILYLLGSYPNCESAIIKMNTSKVDILFLDIEVPGMNGLEFLEKYKLLVRREFFLLYTSHWIVTVH